MSNDGARDWTPISEPVLNALWELNHAIEGLLLLSRVLVEPDQTKVEGQAARILWHLKKTLAESRFELEKVETGFDALLVEQGEVLPDNPGDTSDSDG